jgi:acetyl-CoA acetyltransferase
MKEVVILSAQRTAIGAFLGSLKDITALNLEPRLSKPQSKEAVCHPVKSKNVSWGRF